MAKFLKVNTATNGKFLIPADGFVFARRGSSTQTFIYIESSNNFESIILINDPVTSSDEQALVQFIQDEMVDLAQTHWTNAVVDITDRIPKPYNITNVTTN